MHLTSLRVLFLMVVIASPILATRASSSTGAAVSRAAVFRSARAFAIKSGCKIISMTALCDAVDCFRHGGRCDMIMDSGTQRGRCVPQVLLSNGVVVPRAWGVKTNPEQCRGCKCEALPGARKEKEGAKEENMGGDDISHDADFHRFLREVVLREPPGQQAAPSPKRQKVRQSLPSLRQLYAEGNTPYNRVARSADMIYAPVRHSIRTMSIPCETAHVDESFKEAAIDINARKISLFS